MNDFSTGHYIYVFGNLVWVPDELSHVEFYWINE